MLEKQYFYIYIGYFYEYSGTVSGWIIAGPRACYVF
jgi:hypothetical protein